MLMTDDNDEWSDAGRGTGRGCLFAIIGGGDLGCILLVVDDMTPSNNNRPGGSPPVRNYGRSDGRAAMGCFCVMLGMVLGAAILGAVVFWWFLLP